MNGRQYYAGGFTSVEDLIGMMKLKHLYGTMHRTWGNGHQDGRGGLIMMTIEDAWANVEVAQDLLRQAATEGNKAKRSVQVNMATDALNKVKKHVGERTFEHHLKIQMSMDGSNPKTISETAEEIRRIVGQHKLRTGQAYI